MYGICRCPIVRNLEFGDLLLGGIPRGIRSGMADCPFRMHFVLMYFMRMVVESLDELVRVNLKIDSVVSQGIARGIVI